MPAETNLFGDLVRQGVTIGVNSPSRVRDIEAAEFERAQQAERDEWHRRIREDELDLQRFRDRGLNRAQNPLADRVPEAYQYLVGQVRDELGIVTPPERFHGRRRVTVG